VDVVVVGGGIAGMSLAGELSRLAPRWRLLLVEAEPQLAYHTTGRSAAAYLESYGSPEIRALTRASGRALAGLDGPPLLTPRPLLWTAAPGRLAALTALLAAVPTLHRVDVAEAVRRCPALRADRLAGAAVEDGARDVDVDGVYQHYRRLARAGGVEVRAGAPVEAGERVPGGWRLRVAGEPLRARIVVDAAGAWGDVLAARLGVAPVGLAPLRRTAAVAASDRVDPSWPLVSDVDEAFYFRPDSGGLLVSPADETPSEPVDARPDPLDVARALEAVNAATTLGLRSVRTAWAGLRTFAPDRNPVVGFAPGEPGFCWLVGQGGYGIQTAPALARTAAALLVGDPDAVPAGVDPDRLSPARFR
jgi:D-arginine dehydrogenase